MSKLQETINDMKNDITVQIHFYECWDETLFMTLSELEEWFDFIADIINNENISKIERFQKVVDSITKE